MTESDVGTRERKTPAQTQIHLREQLVNGFVQKMLARPAFSGAGGRQARDWLGEVAARAFDDVLQSHEVTGALLKDSMGALEARFHELLLAHVDRSGTDVIPEARRHAVCQAMAVKIVRTLAAGAGSQASPELLGMYEGMALAAVTHVLGEHDVLTPDVIRASWDPIFGRMNHQRMQAENYLARTSVAGTSQAGKSSDTPQPDGPARRASCCAQLDSALAAAGPGLVTALAASLVAGPVLAIGIGLGTVAVHRMWSHREPNAPRPRSQPLPGKRTSSTGSVVFMFDEEVEQGIRRKRMHPTKVLEPEILRLRLREIVDANAGHGELELDQMLALLDIRYSVSADKACAAVAADVVQGALDGHAANSKEVARLCTGVLLHMHPAVLAHIFLDRSHLELLREAGESMQMVDEHLASHLPYYNANNALEEPSGKGWARAWFKAYHVLDQNAVRFERFKESEMAVDPDFESEPLWMVIPRAEQLQGLLHMDCVDDNVRLALGLEEDEALMLAWLPASAEPDVKGPALVQPPQHPEQPQHRKPRHNRVPAAQMPRPRPVFASHPEGPDPRPWLRDGVASRKPGDHHDPRKAKWRSREQRALYGPLPGRAWLTREVRAVQAARRHKSLGT